MSWNSFIMDQQPKSSQRTRKPKLTTPYYLIHEKKLLRNLKIIQRVRNSCGAKSLLALKCFSAWSVFDLMRPYMDGTTSSSLFEARLGYEKFGKETHAYCVGFTQADCEAVKPYADKIIFNSISQLKRFADQFRGIPVGLRINPGISHSDFELADPARPYSRLGVIDYDAVHRALPLISGVMIHCNCENDDFSSFCRILDHIFSQFEYVLEHCDWISLGGGISFTKEGYPLEAFCKRLLDLHDRYKIQVYLEPGESAITHSAELVTNIVDIVKNKIDIAICDASTEAHMLDLLTYRQAAKMTNAENGPYSYMVAGRSCLAGDVFGTYHFASKLKIGQVLRIQDAAGYSMVKKNWFNGLQMPSIVVKRLDGTYETVRAFKYNDFVNNL